MTPEMEAEARKDRERYERELQAINDRHQRDIEGKTEAYRKQAEQEAERLRKELEKQHQRDIEFRKSLVQGKVRHSLVLFDPKYLSISRYHREPETTS